MYGKNEILSRKLSELSCLAPRHLVPGHLAPGHQLAPQKIDSGQVLSGILPHRVLHDLAMAEKVSLKDLEILSLELGLLPERYIRNLNSLSIKDQLALRKTNIFMVGLGGLGGHCLDFLLRLGVGSILAVDGDSFEPSNFNRQLLSSSLSAGLSKAKVAHEYAAKVNPAVDFTSLHEFTDQKRVEELLHQTVQPFNLIVDALGGLSHRMQLQAAANEYNLPVVTAAIGGWSGYVALVPPGSPNPAQFLGQSGGAEDALGTPAPTVAFAASLQIKLALEALLFSAAGEDCQAQTLFFDLSTHSLDKVTL